MNLVVAPGQSVALFQIEDLFPNVNLSRVPTKGTIEVRDKGSTGAWTVLKKDDQFNFRSKDVRYLASATAKENDTDSFAFSERYFFDVLIATPRAPEITTQPEDQMVPYFSNTGADEGATLTVVATGVPTPSYQWYQGATGDTSQPINGATGASYHTPGLTQTTEYWVKVINDVGTVNSRTVKVTVDPLPHIVFQPNSLTISSGEAPNLGVYAVGHGLTYQWFKGQPGDTSSPATGQQNSEIYQAPPLTQTTTYWVRVSNSAGSVDSEAATVTVNGTPKIVTQPSDPEVEKGAGTTLSVTAAGAPTLIYQWYRGDSGDTSRPIAGATGSTLNTGPLHDSATFWVRVSNSVGAADSTTSAVAVIPVYDILYATAVDSRGEPITTAQVVIPDQFGLRGSLRTLSAPTSGWLFPTIDTGYNQHLHRNPSAVDVGLFGLGQINYRVKVGATAAFDEFTITDGGGSDSGPITRTVRIAINYPAQIASQPSGASIFAGHTASMSVTATGDGPLTYQWYEGQPGDITRPVSGATGDTLITPALSAPTAFWVRVSNAFGTVDSGAASVTLNPPPSITTQPGDVAIFSGQGTTLSASVDGVSLAYQWYRGTSGDTTDPIPDATVATYTTPNLDATATYWVRVSNPAGSADSRTITVTVNERTQTVVTVVGGTFTYDATAHAATATATGVDGVPLSGTFTLTYDGSATPPADAGTYTVQATFTSDDPKYTDAVGTGTLVINLRTPTVLILQRVFNYDGNPHPVRFSVLGPHVVPFPVPTIASLPVNGSVAITYNGSATAPTLAGAYEVVLTFTSRDPNFANATHTTTLTINQATPTINWPTPGAISYGTALGADQLNATASRLGTFAYSEEAGTILDAGTYVLSATFTPTDNNYKSVSAEVMLTVNKASQTISWADPADIDYGTPLSDTQLNASVSVAGPAPAGALSYTPAAGTLVNIGAAQVLSVTAAETANYHSATATVTIDVLKPNEAPTDLALSFSHLAENRPAETLVGTFSSTDPDAGDRFSYRLAGGPDDEFFEIGGDQLRTAGAFDFEVRSSFSIRVQTTDDRGLSLIKDFTIGVTDMNEPTTITSDQAAVTVNEGSPVTNTGTFSDPEGNSTVTLTASLGTVTQDNVTGTWSWSHTLTDGPVGAGVIITATDSGGLTATTSFTLTVTNAAPTATLSNDGPVNESSQATVNFSNPSDPSSTDTTAGFRYSFALSAADLATNYAAAGTATAANFAFADNGSYTVFGRIFDKDGGFTDAATTVMVNNVAPTITTFTVPGSGTEGSPVILSAAATDPAGTDDPLSYLWTISGPNGSTFTLEGESPSFTPVDEGSYAVSLTVRDGDSGAVTQTRNIAVANVAPTVAISGASNATEGAVYSLTLGAVTDPGADAVSRYIVHWGDGSSDTYTTAGPKSHIYADGPATRDITVDLVDDDGTHTNCANSLSLSVNSAALSAAMSGPSSGVRGQPRSFTVSASAVSSADQAAGFVYSINWGDGSPLQTIARAAGNGSGVAVEHIFAASGKYTVTVTATDKDNATSPAASHTVSIVAVQMQGDDLVVGGTTGNEAIALTAGAKSTVKAWVGGASQGSFSPTGKIVVYGQAGNDKIQVANRVALPAWLYGGDGNDSLRGTRNADILMGGAGNDAIYAGAGIDDVDGGDGNDLLVGAGGADVLMGGAGNDAIRAGAGNDWVDGSAGDDVITGGAGHDTLFGGAGHDRVNGGDGSNVALGGEGNDTLMASLGRDMLIGGLGGDRLGGSGGDLLIAGPTAFDGNQAALDAIMSEWVSSRSYTTRVANLKGAGSGPRANGDYFLNVSGPDVTVFDDDAADTLRTASGSDWNFANLSGDLLDTVLGLARGEVVEELEILAP